MNSSLNSALLLSGILLLAIALITLFKRRRQSYASPLILFSLVNLMGIGAIFIEISSYEKLWAIGYVLLFAFLSFLPFSWYHLCSRWSLDSGEYPHKRRIVSYLFLAVSGLFFCVMILLKGVDISLINNRWFISLDGWRFYYGVYFIIALSAGVYSIENSFRSALGLARERIKKSFMMIVAAAVCYLSLTTVGFLYGQFSDWVLTVSFVCITLVCLLLIRHYISFDPEAHGIIITRKGVYSSIAIVLIGVYFLIIGAIGEFLVSFELDEGLFFSIVVFSLIIITIVILLISQIHRSRTQKITENQTPYKEDAVYGIEWREFAEEITVLLDIEKIYSRTARLLHRLLKIEDCFFLIKEPEPSTNNALYCAGKINRGIPGAKLNYLNEWLHRFGRPVETASLTDNGEELANQYLSLADKIPFDAFLLVPIIARQEFLGFLGVGTHSSGRELESEEVAFIEAAARPLALTILSARMTGELLISREIESYHRFSSFVLHDLKNSVGMLSMLLQNAERNMEDPEFQKEALLTISKAVDRQKKIIYRLTEERSSDILDKQQVDIGKLIEDTLKRIRLDTIPSVAVSLNLIEGIKAIVDEEKIGSVFDNLIMNAIEAMPGGGEISISTSFSGDHGEFIEVRIKDSGSGMDEEYIATRLFKPFSSTKKHGLGIGMYQSREIILLHNGRIEVTSILGQGTEFTIILPGEK
ncbi:MAG: GAF domain-containing protein [candidate division Zixibacteria bacterium]|nr:GAF domain-containing protein [candidate division Zixibacteria bacterium]